MKRSWTMWMVFGLVIYGTTSTMGAQEHPGKTLEEKKQQRAAPASSTSTVAPKMTWAEGSITALDLKSQTPGLKLSASDGKVWAFALNPKTVVVWKNGQLSKPEELKAGDRVKVRYTQKDGKTWAKSIDIVQAPKPTNTFATSTPAPIVSTATAVTPATPPAPPTAAPTASPAAPTEQKAKSN